MERDVCFERCIDFLARMFEKYGDGLESIETAAIETEDDKGTEGYKNL